MLSVSLAYKTIKIPLHHMLACLIFKHGTTSKLFLTSHFFSAVAPVIDPRTEGDMDVWLQAVSDSIDHEMPPFDNSLDWCPKRILHKQTPHF